MQVLLAALSLAAPVPKEAKAPPGLAHGVYTIQWAGRPYQSTLSGNGDFSEFCEDGPLWLGRWEWDAETRILTVSESTNGEWFFKWTIVLDDKLAGTTGGGTRVRIAPFRPPMTMEGK